MAAAEKAGESTRESANYLVEPRFERIGGVEYAMSSPGYKHQIAAGRIFGQLDAQLAKYGCIPLLAPFDVYPLYDLGDEDTFVQPDIFTACDKAKLKENRCNGAPKFIIEILSSNRSHDMVAKLNLYQKAGVLEYWMVDPDERIITVLELSKGMYICRTYDAEAEREVPLRSIPGASVDFSAVFDFPPTLRPSVPADGLWRVPKG
jgi:Uma2 family endonuclease